MSFVHLHVHTYYSILDGAANISKLFERAQADGQPALAITDHGNMFGVKEFLNVAKRFPDVKPIVGSEIYVARGSRHDKRGREDLANYHLVLLAKDHIGYKNLIKLSSYGYIEGFYGRPMIDRELIEKYSEGLICLSACLGGEVPQAILNGRVEEAREVAKWYSSIYGEDYYLEIQRHPPRAEGAATDTFPDQQIANEEIIKIGEELGIKVVATNDVHFVAPEDRDAHDRLICLNTNSDLDDPNRLRYTKEEYLKSGEEMLELFSDHPEVISNTLEVAEKVERYSIDSDPITPHFPLPEGFDNSDHYLRHLTYSGAEERYGTLEELHKERIDFELGVIERMGYPDYFLVVSDFIAEARRRGVSVGPGRGSAAGSVVAYCLKITNIDPIKYGLLFERFLNPDRVSMPDIDIDFDDEGRAKVLEYVEEKYGKDHVAHVITFGTMAARSAIRDVGRVQKLPLPETDRLAKLVPTRFPDTKEGERVKANLENSYRLVPELSEAYNSGSPLVKETLEYALKLEGTVRNVGVHASAIIIGRDDLREYIPICTTLDKESGERIWLSQYEGSQIEEVGMLKMDFLGLKTLSIIKDAVANINQAFVGKKSVSGKQAVGSKKPHNWKLDLEKLPLDDKKTYKLFSRGDTIGTFQFESDGMRKWLRELKPSVFEDLIAMNALYRPGPMDYIPDFIARKHGQKKIHYDLPIMEEILSSTYGVTVYQEQVMLLSQKIAGLTKGDADSLRKAIGRKERATMDKLKTKFLEGGAENGHPEEVLEKVWRDWEAFAEYAFNKSHSTCYALLGYQTAYLKANYSSHYMASVLSHNLNDIDELTKLMDECRRMKIEVLGPDVNESVHTFTVNDKGNIRFGLGAIKGVGAGAVEAIVNCRREGPFTSIFDFVERVNLSTVNRKTIESLVFAGAFDSFEGISREQYLGLSTKDESFIEALIKYGNLYQNDTIMSGNSLFGDSVEIELVTPTIPLIVEEGDQHQLLKKEKELIGIYLSAHPLDRFKFEMQHFTDASIGRALEMAREASSNPRFGEQEVTVAGIISSSKTSYSQRSGKPYISFTVEDFDGAYNFTLFGRDYETFMQYIQPNLALLIGCSISPKYGYGRRDNDEQGWIEYELKIRKIRLLSNVREEFIRGIQLSLPVEELNDSFRKELLSQLKENKGRAALELKLLDYHNKISVEYVSTKYRVAITDAFIQYLDSNSINYELTQA